MARESSDEGEADATPTDPAPEGAEATVPPSERVEALESEVDQLRERITSLETDLEAARGENEELTDRLARAKADYENYKKRANRAKREAAREARVEMVGVLAEAVDNVNRAMAADPDPEVRKGLELVLRQIETALEDLGVVKLAPAQGDPFDPNEHEALITEETSDFEPETVIERLAPGYQLEDRQVRPAMVKVAKAPSEDEG